METVVTLLIGLVAWVVLAWLIEWDRRKALQRERDSLRDELAVYVEAHSRSAYPVDIEVLKEEWRG